MIYFNIIISLFSLWAILYVYNNHISRTLFDAKICKLFALRDELTLMVMGNKLDGESKEYGALLYSINHYINATRQFEIITFLRRLNELQSNEKIQNEIECIKSGIENHSSELKQIMLEYFQVLDSIYDRHMRCFVWSLRLMISALISCKISVEYTKKAFNLLSASSEHKKEIEENHHFFKNAAIV